MKRLNNSDFKITQAQLIAIGQAIAERKGPGRVERVDFRGQSVDAKQALDAFEEAQIRAFVGTHFKGRAKIRPPEPEPTDPAIELMKGLKFSSESDAEEFKKLLEEYLPKKSLKTRSKDAIKAGRERIKPAPEVGETKTVLFVLDSGSFEPASVNFANPVINAISHPIQALAAAVANAPGAGVPAYCTAAGLAALSAATAYAAQQPSTGKQLWSVAKTNLWRVLFTRGPGRILHPLIMSQELKAIRYGGAAAATIDDIMAIGHHNQGTAK